MFREFIDWTNEGNCKFSVIGSMNAVSYKEVFPLIKQNKVGWDTPIPVFLKVPIDKIQSETTKIKNDETCQIFQKFGNIYGFPIFNTERDMSHSL